MLSSSRLYSRKGVALTLGIGLAVLLAIQGVSQRTSAQTGSFTFTAQGDHGSTSNTTAVLNAVAGSGSSFTLALGDLSYTSVGQETTWCNYVKNIVGQTYPFELIAGNHEDDGQANGWIGNFIQCLPDRLGVSGVYGAEYYFDYGNARFILASAASSVNGVNYNYNTIGGAHYNWMRDRIREGKAAGKWVIVGVHKNCITPGTKSCEIGQNFLTLLMDERVDLVLQGHDHIYARSKQLTCATVGSYNSTCVADSDDEYTRGAGTVIVIDGAAGVGHYTINANDSERNYFVKAMGGNGNWNFVTGASGPDKAFGTVKGTVSDTRLDVQFVAGAGTGNFTDSFSIVNAGPTATPTLTSTPTATNIPATPTPTGTLASATPTPTSTPTATVTATSTGGPAAIAFQDGILPDASYAGTRDTVIKQGTSNTNYGSATTLDVDGNDGGGADKSILIKWDTSAILIGKTVTAASLTFRVINSSVNSYQLYELKRNWTESQATWNIFSTGNNWQTAGAFGADDRGSTILGTAGPASSGTFHTVTLNAAGLALVQNWINNPGANFGLIIANASSSDGLDFRSSETSTATQRPKLTISYQP